MRWLFFIAIESLVSISSLSIFEIRTTMSSTSQNSYLRGSTLGGPSDGLDRLGEFRLDVTTDDVLVEPGAVEG